MIISRATAVVDQASERMRTRRPRLADDVVVRRNVIGDDERVALFDAAERRTYVIDARAWTILAGCDGTRDVPGISAAAARHGVFVGEGHVAGFLDQLDRAGLLVDGPPEDLIEGEPSSERASKPLVEMPGARYRCDGRGGCCSTYASIVLTPDDIHRACATLPARGEAGHRPTHVFLPLAGSAPTALRAITHVDGACLYLDRDGRCGLHRAAGAAAKPVGCRWYPARLVDLGTEIRVVPSVECSCIARPVSGGDPLVPHGITDAAELPLGVTTTAIAATVELADGHAVARARAFDEVDAIAAGLDDREPVEHLWRSAATSIGAHAGDVADEIAVRFAALGPRCRARAEAEAAWRGSGHPLVRRLGAMALAADVLAAPTALRALLGLPASDPALEAHVLRACVFGRLWLVDAPMVERLRGTAIALAWARALPAFTPDDLDDPTTRETPLAAVQASWRTALPGR